MSKSIMCKIVLKEIALDDRRTIERFFEFVDANQIPEWLSKIKKHRFNNDDNLLIRDALDIYDDNVDEFLERYPNIDTFIEFLCIISEDNLELCAEVQDSSNTNVAK